MTTPGANIKHLRLLLGATQGEFAQQLGVAQSTLSNIERGRRSPSLATLNTVRFYTHVDANYFSEPIRFYDATELFFRTARQGQARNDSIAAAFSICEHYLAQRYSSITSDLPTVGLPDSGSPISRQLLEEYAAETRAHFGIDPDGFIPHVTSILHKHGILVTSLPDYVVEGTNFDGVSSPNPTRLRVIALNRQRSGDRYRFSLAHELAHLVLHAGSMRGDKSQLEDEANIFAASFLMPRSLLEPVITPEMTLMDYVELKSRWGYSIQAIVRRSYELGLIDYKRYRSLRMQIAGRGWNVTEPVDVLLENTYVETIDILSPPDSLDLDQDNEVATITELRPR